MSSVPGLRVLHKILKAGAPQSTAKKTLREVGAVIQQLREEDKVHIHIVIHIEKED